jgi:RNA polymerase sigma-70 factor (ECF subfamily)
MIKVWRKAPTFSPDQASASTWMYTIARNTRIDWLRKHSKRHSLEELTADEIYDEQDDKQETPYSNLIHVRNQTNIRERLAELPIDQLNVLTMMYFQGKSGQEVADELSIPLGTVKSRARLALQKLKVRLDEEAFA